MTTLYNDPRQSARVLLIEDDTTQQQLVATTLRAHAFAVDVAATAAHGQALALDHDYDAIVLDLGLPDGDGIDLLRALRERGRNQPVIILSGRNDASTVVQGLDAGADDFVRRPVASAELIARLRAVLRRGRLGDRRLVLGTLQLDRFTRRALVNEKELTFTRLEVALLEQLLLHPGQVVSRAALLDRVWNLRHEPASNILDAHVARLRAKLDAGTAWPRIHTVRGRGFALVMPDTASCGEWVPRSRRRAIA